MKISFYTTSSGRSPVVDYIKELPKTERARLLEALDQVEKHAFAAARVQFRQIEGKLWEMKISAYRIFYVHIEQGELVVLHSYRKQSQKLPTKEKELALKRMKEIL